MIKSHLHKTSHNFLFTGPTPSPDAFHTPPEDYASNQIDVNSHKVDSFLIPLLRTYNSKKILDVGCGVGKMTTTLQEKGYDAYGVDIIGLEKYWVREQLSPDHFFFVHPSDMELPFENNSLDFIYSFGVIEHVGTKEGHSSRLPDYHNIRKQWLLEIFRVLKPGKQLLLGGPNASFPFDVAHGHDGNASKIERLISHFLGCTVHKTWGNNFLWRYSDINRYLSSESFSMQPLRIDSFLGLSRVPKLLKAMVRIYLQKMPESLLNTGFNPWVMALITKNVNAS